MPDDRAAQLEALIDEAPEDLDAYRAYADWLEQNGEPRRNQLLGLHVIRDQMTAGSVVDRNKLDHFDERLTALFEAHRDYYWGDMAKVMPLPSASRQRRDNAPIIDWRNGFIYRADLKRVGRVTMDKVLSRLLASTSGRFLVELVAGWPEDPSALVAVLAKQAPLSLRRLDISTNEADLSELWRAIPRLDTLKLSHAKRYGVIDLPVLRTLHITSHTNADTLGDALGEARLPQLRTLVLDFSQDIDHIVRVVERSSFAAQLTELQLRDAIVARGTKLAAIATPIERS
jgi:uncharacterized protein (TIGR02996 family)